MKALGLVILISIIGCGEKESNSKKHVSSRQEREENAGQKCLLNHKWVKCSTLQEADGQGVDVLDTLIDVPAQVGNGVITFTQSAISRDQGRRISCVTQVENGDTYKYTLQGSTLIVDTDQGRFEYKRFSGGPGVKGSWMWKGYIGTGTLNVKTLTVIGNNRVILRDHCEL
ncbi:MAG TPA: hypothetical protein VKY27_10180 [Bacteriovoracaceae bacterium]|nr:hypothetical protein [Bacteriovoracaceae bacterium]